MSVVFEDGGLLIVIVVSYLVVLFVLCSLC